MRKKMKFLIGLIITLILIGFVFGIATIYRFCKLQKIWSRVEQNVEKDNFYMETTIVNKGTSKKTQSYYKEGIGKFVSQDGSYIWFNGANAYSIDETNKLASILNPEEAIGVVYKESFASLYPGYEEGFFGRLMFAGDLSNKIKSGNYNGQKCTVIIVEEENYTKTYWITKDFSNLVQAKMEFSNGDVYEYKYDIKFHSTRLKDVELPDISEYTVTEAATGETVEINTLENDKKLQTQNLVVENIVENTQPAPIG